MFIIVKNELIIVTLAQECCMDITGINTPDDKLVMDVSNEIAIQ